MSYRNIDPDRFRWLLRTALPHFEREEFFSTKRVPLLTAGERVQTAPRPSDEVQTIMRFGAKAQHIFKEWVLETISRPTPEDLDQLVARFRSAEECNLKFKPEQLKEFARAGLWAFMSEDGPSEWHAFLNTPVPNKLAERPSTAETREVSNPVPRQLAQWSAGAIGTAELDSTARWIAQVVHMAVESGQAPRLLSSVDFTHFPELRVRIEQLAASEAGRASLARGPIVSQLAEESLATVGNVLAGEVIARCTSAFPDKPAYFSVEGFLLGGRVFCMSHADTTRALPDTGQLILHPDAAVAIPSVGDIGSWVVERRQTQYSIKVAIRKRGDGLFKVVELSARSDQHDLVRQSIQRWAARPSYHQVVFLTTDGLCIYPDVEPNSRLSHESSFDSAFDAWEALPATQIGQERFVIGPLPPSGRPYDCSPFLTWARRILRRVAEPTIGLTQKQLTALAASLANLEEFDKSRLAKLREGLEQLGVDSPQYQDFLNELMAMPQVKRDLEARKAEVLQRMQAEREQETAYLEEVRRQRDGMRRQLNEMETERKELVQKTRAAVKKAFESARANELKTLGDLSLLNIVAGDRGDRRRKGDPQLQGTRFRKNSEPVGDCLSDYGVEEKPAEVVAFALKLAQDLRIPVVISGAGAAYIAHRIARSLVEDNGMAYDVPVGLITAQPALGTDVAEGDISVVLLQNANLSDLSVYGGSLLNLAIQSVAETSAKKPPWLVLSSGSGVTALPWPADLAAIAFHLDLSILGILGSLQSMQLPQTGSDEDSGTLSPLRKRLLARISRYESSSETEAIALGLFAARAFSICGAGQDV